MEFDIIKLSFTALLILFLSTCCSEKKEVIKIDIKQGQFLITCTINDIIEGRFLIDTGTSNTVITPEVLNKLKLKSNKLELPENAYTGNPNINLSEIHVVSSPLKIAFKKHSMKLSPVYVLDLDKMLNKKDLIQGLLGTDFLKNLLITVDYKDSLLIIENKTGLSRRLAEGIKISGEWGSINYFEVILNDSIKSKYNLDTGLPITSISLNDLSALGFNENSPNVERINYQGFGGEISVLSTNLNSFSLGNGLEVKNLKVHAFNEKFGAIGTNYLTNFMVTYNFGENYIILKRFKQ